MVGPAGDSERNAFESAIRALQSDVAFAASFATIDGGAREYYVRTIAQFSAELRNKAASGKLTWAEAAKEANQTRNMVMDVVRSRSSPVGRAVAEQIKSQGKTLNTLIAEKTLKLYGNAARFDKLTPAQVNAIYKEIIISAGKADPVVTMWMRRASRAGRGLLVISIGVSVYTVATAEDKGAAAKREVAVAGSGILGGAAAGALAGLACGPGAPVCVGVGAFIGGSLAAFGVDYFW